MKIFKYYILALASTLVFGAQSAYSQSQVTYGGVLLDLPGFSHFDLLQLSQYDYSLSTSRSAAMGGAMVSLGGDMSSVNINPAGVGMFRSVTATFTTDLNISHTRSDFNAFDRSKTRFTLNNMGLAVPVYEGLGNLTGVSFAFSYNRLADFHYRGGASLPAGASTISDIFVAQLNGLYPYMSGNGWNGINAADLEDFPFDNRNIFVEEWGGVLGYLTYLNEPDSPTGSTYFTTGIAGNAVINPSVWYTTKGYINEYSMAFGFNIRNMLYLGATFAAQDIMLSKEIYYGETYDNNTSGNVPDMFRRMTYGQFSKLSGWGMNIKLGAIIRPIESLRIGLAYHTPTWVRDFTQDYAAAMQTVTLSNVTERVNSPYVWTNYDFNTPSRLLAGVSYTIGNRAIISADYEAVWYAHMKLKNNRDLYDSFKANVRNDFKTANNFRFGAEFRVTPLISLRAGYANYGSVLSNNYETIFYLASNRAQNISGGIGFRVSAGTTIDLTYVYATQKLKDYDLFYLAGDQIMLDHGSIQPAEITTASPVTNPKYENHLISMSVNFRF